MFKLTKRIAILATMVLAASAPSAAYARFIPEPPTAAPAASSQTVLNASPLSAGTASASSTQDFQWDDAAIGAASVLLLLSVASGAMIVRRRRTQHPLTS
jgi:hypothetical protein